MVLQIIIKTKYLWDLQQKIVWQLNNDQKATKYTMNALKKSSELWLSSSGFKARPRIGAFEYKKL